MAIQDIISLLPQAAADAVLIGLTYALVAAGLALIWGVADIVNFAYGTYLVLAMLVTVAASTSYGIDPVVMLPINGLLLFVAGYISYKLVIAPVMDAPMESQIFVTFGLFILLQFGMLVIAGPETVSIDAFSLAGNGEFFGVTISYPKLATGIVSALTLGLLFAFLKYTRTGKAIRATAQDREVAQVMGIDTDRTFAITWGIGTAAVGVAGTLLVTFIPAQPEVTPLNWTLIAFAAVALGGFGNVLAAAVGGLVIAFIEQFGVRFLDPSLKQIYVFSMFFLALFIRRMDIFGEQ